MTYVISIYIFGALLALGWILRVVNKVRPKSAWEITDAVVTVLVTTIFWPVWLVWQLGKKGWL